MRASPLRRVCVFCGARSGADAAFAETAGALARAIVSRGWGVAYGGGRVGLMGVVADAAIEAGGDVVGVIPRSLGTKEIAHTGITKLHVVESMHERKALLVEMSDAFVALPGGYGTMDELHEILTWKQLGIHNKPIGILNAGGFYDELLALYAKMHAQGFIPSANLALFEQANDAGPLLDRLLA